jgi:hypothetical protein
MNWIGLKMRPTQTGDRKNTPGKSSSEVVERSADYYKREVPAPTQEYDPASIKVLEGMEPPAQHGEAYMDERRIAQADASPKRRCDDTIDTRFGYQTDMVKTHDEVQKENQ